MLSATPKNFAIQFRPPPPNNEYKTNGTAPQGIRGRATRVWQNAFTYSSNYLWYLFIYLFSSPPLLLPFLFLYDSISFLSFFVFINIHTHTHIFYLQDRTIEVACKRSHYRGKSFPVNVYPLPYNTAEVTVYTRLLLVNSAAMDGEGERERERGRGKYGGTSEGTEINRTFRLVT